MPQPQMVADHADELIRVYRQAWEDIVAEQQRILSDPRRSRRRTRLTQMRRRIESLLDQVDANMRTWMQQSFPSIYRQGALDTAGSALSSWTKLHTDAVQLLARDTFDDLLEATRFVRADTKRFVREASKIASELVTTTDRTAVQGGRQLERLLQRRGITSVIYRDGSRHGLAEYAQMVVRTKTAVAYNIGSLNAGAEQSGATYFEVFDGPDCGWIRHQDADKALGKIVTRDEAGIHPISHPNCRRSFGARPDITTRRATQTAQRSVTAEQTEDIRQADAVRRGVQQRRRRHREQRRRRPVRTTT
jgi:hypothetical protein